MVEGGGSWLGGGGVAAWARDQVSWCLLQAGSLQLLHTGRTHLMAVTHSSLRTDSVLSAAPLRRLVVFWLILFCLRLKSVLLVISQCSPCNKAETKKD